MWGGHTHKHVLPSPTSPYACFPPPLPVGSTSPSPSRSVPESPAQARGSPAPPSPIFALYGTELLHRVPLLFYLPLQLFVLVSPSPPPYLDSAATLCCVRPPPPAPVCGLQLQIHPSPLPLLSATPPLWRCARSDFHVHTSTNEQTQTSTSPSVSLFFFFSVFSFPRSQRTLLPPPRTSPRRTAWVATEASPPTLILVYALSHPCRHPSSSHLGSRR